jgi:hypothetical protein
MAATIMPADTVALPSDLLNVTNMPNTAYGQLMYELTAILDHVTRLRQVAAVWLATEDNADEARQWLLTNQWDRHGFTIPENWLVGTTAGDTVATSTTTTRAA